ncbi:unnamed protein product [Pseudo-nitzschia multistriata]|uniref:Uncharacterized protein n=1 Tax=Pseudo-nitzschia multistriata TaxID=183589 RepID=A0A448ZHE3_9STRA|nr:unnamed protein product [Pseudo-nitzschia multistriata]
MVRNVDQVEALIFYGTNSIFYPKSKETKNQDTMAFLPGVEDLIEECKRDETAVLAILDDHGGTENLPREADIVYSTETAPPPNPRDLWNTIHSIEISPKGFGGSSGFGQKAPDPERSPAPAHCVILCDTEDKCRAARFAGTRVLCLTENDLADGVMNIGVYSDSTEGLDCYWESIYMDDIAMPGSFWLNPPHPKDDEGNGVDVFSVIKSYDDVERKQQQQQKESTQQATNEGLADDINPEDNEGYLSAILMDMDPL